MTRLVIWGCGGMAREVNLLCERRGDHVVGFLDERPEMKGQIVDDLPVLGDISDIAGQRSEVSVLCAGVGEPALRKRLADRTTGAGFNIAGPLLDPGVYLSNRSSIGAGSIVCDGAVMTVNVHIGAHVIVNRLATIGHDSIIEDFVTVSPGVNISGNVVLEEGAFIGTGASIRERTRVGAWAVVAGGAFVKDEVPERSMVAGVPAIVKKQSI